MTTIYLIRHGQASIGTNNYDVLSPMGQRQAGLLGSYFDKIQLRFDQVFTGTLERQKDTAAIALPHMCGYEQRHPGFNEYQHSRIFEHYAPRLAKENDAVKAILNHGHNSKLTYSAFAALMNAWADDNSEQGELESWEQFNDRISSALTSTIDQFTDAENIAIFTSGGVICTILHMITDFPVNKIFEINWGIYNASITTLKVQNATFLISSYNNIPHLELENDRSLITNI